MSKVIQRPLACRNAHCGALCSPAFASMVDSPSRCFSYERRDDLYQNTDVLGKIRAEIEPKCDRINSLASVYPYTERREIQELLCEILALCKAESEE